MSEEMFLPYVEKSSRTGNESFLTYFRYDRLVIQSKSGCVKKSTLKSRCEKEMSNIYFQKITELHYVGAETNPPLHELQRLSLDI